MQFQKDILSIASISSDTDIANCPEDEETCPFMIF